MRILLLNDDLPPEALGGSGKIVSDVSAELAKRGHSVTVLTASAGGTGKRMQNGVEVRTIPILPARWAHYRSVFSDSRAQEILSVIRGVQPDVIHAHGLAWQIGYRWMQSVTGTIPCFYTAHGMMTIAYGKLTGLERCIPCKDVRRARWTYNPLRNVFIRKSFGGLKKIFCVSDALRVFLAEHGHTNLHTLHNGVDTDFWTRLMSQADARAALHLPADAVLFLLSGRLGYDKGLDLLLSLWPSLPQEAHLVLAGSIPQDAATDNPRIHVLRSQNPEGMRMLYSAIDVNLVPSLCFDCFPTTGIESMSCGIPVITGNRGGGREAIVEGDTGFVADPSDENAVREKILWCLGHRSECQKMGERAREHMIKSFSLKEHVDRLLAVYNSN